MNGGASSLHLISVNRLEVREDPIEPSICHVVYLAIDDLRQRGVVDATAIGDLCFGDAFLGDKGLDSFDFSVVFAHDLNLK